MLKWVDSPPFHRNFRIILILIASCSSSTSLSHILYNSCYTTAAIQPYYRSQKRHLLLVRSSVCYLQEHRRQERPLHEGYQASLSDQRLVFYTTKTAHQELKACHRKLAAGMSLDPVLGREPALVLDSLLLYIRIIDVEILLHSNAIARTRTIRIIETTYSSVFTSL